MTESLAMLVILLVAMGWFTRCCDTAPQDCMACIDNAASAAYSVTIPALAEHSSAGHCEDCSGYEGTYLVRYSSTISGFCFFDLHTDDAGACSGDGKMLVRLQIAVGGMVYPIYVTIRTDAGYLWIWKISPDTWVDIDCFFDDQEFISYGSTYDYICDGSGTSVIVSAV